MIFETYRGLYWPIDHDAETATAHFGLIAPLDWTSYEALRGFMREAGEASPELWEPENPFSLPVPDSNLLFYDAAMGGW